MRKKTFSIYITVIYILFFSICMPIQNTYAENIELTCQSAILIDTNTNTVLYEKDADTRRPIASLTKIMTMLLAMEKLQNNEIALNDEVVISQRASEMGGTRLFLEKGEIRTVEDLLYGIAVESGNDAAVALAEYIGKDYDSFIEMMNNKAIALGMKNTHFSTPCGLSDENNYSTARDVAVMSCELLKYDNIFDYIDVWNINVTVGKNNDVERMLTNTNKLLSQTDYVDGIKTGYTVAAGHCISATAQNKDMRLICVILKGADSKSRFEDAKTLLEYGFANYEAKYIVKENDIVTNITIENSIYEQCDVIVKESIYKLKEKNQNLTVESELKLNDDIKAPISKETKIGEIIYKVDDITYTLDLFPSNDIAKLSLTEYLQKIKYFLLP